MCSQHQLNNSVFHILLGRYCFISVDKSEFQIHLQIIFLDSTKLNYASFGAQRVYSQRSPVQAVCLSDRTITADCPFHFVNRKTQARVTLNEEEK